MIGKYDPQTDTITELAGQGGNNVFQGSIEDWNQLTTAEKKAYDHASIPDSLDGNVTFPASKVMMLDGDSVEDVLTANTFGSNISIKGTSSYTCPSDGYIRAFNQQSASGYINIKTNNDLTIYTAYANKMGDYETYSLFVRKGMIFKDDSTANAYGLDFIPIS